MRRFLLTFFAKSKEETLGELWVQKGPRSLTKSPHLILLLSNFAIFIENIVMQNVIYKKDEWLLMGLLTNSLVFFFTLTQALAIEIALRTQKPSLLLQILEKLSRLINFFGFPLIYITQSEALKDISSSGANVTSDIIVHSQTLTIFHLLCSYLNTIGIASVRIWVLALFSNLFTWIFYEIFWNQYKYSTGASYSFFIINSIVAIFIFLLIILYHSWHSSLINQIDSIFKSILSNLDTGVVCINNQNNVIYFNNYIRKIFKGLSDQEIYSKLLGTRIQEFHEDVSEPQHKPILQKQGHFVDFKPLIKKTVGPKLNQRDLEKARLITNDIPPLLIRDILLEGDYSPPILTTEMDENISNVKIYTMQTEEALLNQNDVSGYNQYSIGGSYEESRGHRIRIYEVKVLHFSCNQSQLFKGFKLLTFSDITNISMIHEMKAERAFKVRLLDNFSHELFTPLNSSLTILNTAQEDKQFTNEAKNMYLVPSIISLKSLKCVLNNITDYLKYETNQLNLELNEFKLIYIVKEALDMIRTKREIKGLGLKLNGSLFDLINPKPLIVCSDPFKIKRIIYNLLSDCLKYSFKGDLILSISQPEDLSFFEIEIEDTREISELDYIQGDQDESEFNVFISQKLAKILAPVGKNPFIKECNVKGGIRYKILIKNHLDEISPSFFSPKSSLKDTKELEKASSLLEQTSLIFDLPTVLPPRKNSFIKPSHLGNFNTFYLTSPKLIESPNENISSKNKAMENARVLLVDDEAFNILSLEMIINKWGMKCLKAYNGKVAIEMLKENYNDSQTPQFKIGLIFMDLMMPVMDGLECTKSLVRLMKEGHLPLTPIFACSANDSTINIAKCKEAGMTGFLAKPLTFQRINDILRLYFQK
jgi:CheY-like chemotaxis protein/signal transduction histidine kinase/PAS domain-containing protein